MTEEENKEINDEDIDERLVAQEQTIQELKGMLEKCLHVIDVMHNEQSVMRSKLASQEQAAMKTIAEMSKSIAHYISIDQKDVAKEIIANSDWDIDTLLDETSRQMNLITSDSITALENFAAMKNEDIKSIYTSLQKDLAKLLASYILEDDGFKSTLSDKVTPQDIVKNWEVDYAHLSEYVDVEMVSEYMDAQDVAGHLSLSYVASEIDLYRLQDYIDKDDIAEHIDVNEIVQHLDYSTIVDASEVAEYVDVESVAEHIDVDDVAGYIDIDILIEALAPRILQMMLELREEE